MKRKFKFRAWDKVMNVMYHDGNLANGDVMVMNIEGGLQFSSNDTYKENDFVIMQYTGVKDFYDAEIFEGDIVAIENDEIGSIIPADFKGEVTYLEYGFYVIDKEKNVAFPVWQDIATWLIVGNIYEVQQ